MFIRPVISGKYKVKAKRLGNGTDYFSRTNWPPSGWGDMTFVASYRYENIGSSTPFLGGNVSPNRLILDVINGALTTHKVGFERVTNTAGTIIVSHKHTGEIEAAILEAWHSYAITFRSSTGAWEVWINGVKYSGPGTAGTADWTGGALLGAWFAGDNPGVWQNVSHIWIAHEYVDMTTEYSQFFDVNHKPIGLGADGSTPTGRQPEHFAPGGNLAVNLGTESNWVKNGTIADSADSPTG